MIKDEAWSLSITKHLDVSNLTRLTIAAMILQKHAIFVLNDLTLDRRDRADHVFANVALLDQIVSFESPQLKAISLQWNSKT